VDGQVAESGHAVDDARARGATQDSAARVGCDGDVDCGGTAGDGIAEAILDGHRNRRADGDGGGGVGRLLAEHEPVGRRWGNVEAGTGRAGQTGARSGERISAAGRADRQVAEGGRTVDCARGRDATQGSTAGVGADGDGNGGGAAGDDVTETVLDAHLN